MREARLIKTGEIDPSAVDASRRIRKVTENGVALIIASYEELGVIKDPVDLRRVKGSDTPRLMAGGHRLEAARRLGIQVSYKLWDCTNAWAHLCELDDNLAGADLNPLDTAVFLAQRKVLYEKLHPETARGHAGATARWDATDNVAVASFVVATAEKFGVSERNIYRLVAAGAALSDDDLAWLQSAPKPVTLVDLQAISKITESDERAEICMSLAEGRVKSAAEAIKTRSGKTPVQDPVEAAFKALRQAWARAPKDARRRFVSAERREIDGLLQDVITDDLRDHVEGGDA